MPGKEFYRWQVRSFTVLLGLDVVDRLNRALRHPQMSVAEEHGGLLFGRSIDGSTVEVTDFELVRSSHRRGIAYDLSPTERSRVGQQVQRLSHRRGPRPVGCFRTHLRPGLFLDQSDVALLTETGFDGSGIALAIRTNQSGAAEAGIFFREDDDVDGRQPALKFPLDSEALRVQGPIEKHAAPGAIGNTGGGPRVWEHIREYGQGFRSRALVSALTYGLAGAILALAMVAGLHQRSGDRAAAVGSRARFAVSDHETASLGPVQAPPPVFDDENATIDDAETTEPSQAQAEATTPAPQEDPARSPFGSAERSAPSIVTQRQVQHIAMVSPPTAPPPAPVEASIAAPALPPVNPVPVPVPEPVAVVPPPVRRDVNIEVSIEPKEDGALKRAARTVPAAMGHVPLLGRLPGLRHDNESLVPARPDASLRPQLPPAVSRNLAEQVEVDVDASIDNQGAVRNTEVVREDDAELAALAQKAVRAVHWKPAHSGDHNVSMNVVVHYRFNPAAAVQNTAAIEKAP